MKVSLFENSTKSRPQGEMTMFQFLKRIKEGYWKKQQDKVRKASGKEQKDLKRFETPGVTLSGTFKKKRAGFPDEPSGFIGIDVDDVGEEMDDLREKLQDDPFVCGLFSSIRGEGLCIIFRINSTDHAELFNGIQDYLYKEYEIVADRQVKDEARLRYVSYDPLCYIDLKKKKFKTKIKSTPPPKLKDEHDEHTEQDIEELVKEIESQGRDVVPGYAEWYAVGQALATLGERGRKFYHRLSKFGDYDKRECDNQFDNCLKQEESSTHETRVGLGTVFFYAKEAGIKLTPPKIVHKKKKKREAKETHPDTILLSQDSEKISSSVYVYHLWEFKILFKKDEQATVTCTGLSNEAASDFLFNLGIRRSGKTFYHIVDNVVEVITLDWIMDVVVQEGVKLPREFVVYWDDESDHVTRKTILDAVQRTGRRVIERELILKEFNPENELFLVDNADICFLYFANGVVEINADGFVLIPYEALEGYVWREQIIEREFNEGASGKSLIQTIMENAVGKDYLKEIKSALGFMVHNHTQGQGTEILFCIDGSVGEVNEGGNGKDFFSQIVGNVRSLVRVPGKNLNMQQQFTWEQINRDTQVVWIEDLGKHVKMEQMYNMNNGIKVRRMHTQPFIVKAKIGVSLQHLIQMEGSSDQRRQIFLIFTDYYGKRKGIGAVHGDKDIFGEEWTGWDEYYMFVVKSVVAYLKHGLIQMDKTRLEALRKDELSDGAFENLELGKWYSTESAIELCWGDDQTITTEVYMNFKRKLSQWCKLSGYTFESTRKFIDGKQRKAICVSAPLELRRDAKTRKMIVM